MATNTLGKESGMTDAGRAGVGGSIGSVAGTLLGAYLGGPVGASLGGTLGAGIGGALDSAGGPDKSRQELENERRLLKLQKLEEQNMLGLSVEEKDALQLQQVTAGGANLQRMQDISAQAGAAGMATGAGQDQLRGAAAGQSSALMLANISRDIQQKDIMRKRELEEEMKALTASISEYEERINAEEATKTKETISGGMDAFSMAQTAEGAPISQPEISAAKKQYGFETNEEALEFIQWQRSNGAGAAEYSSLVSGGGEAAAAGANPAYTSTISSVPL